MRAIMCGFLLIVAGCSATPSTPPHATHICVKIPNNLVECEILGSALPEP